MESDCSIAVLNEWKDTFDYLYGFFKIKPVYTGNENEFRHIKDISFDHRKPEIRIAGITRPLIFPHCMLDYCDKNEINKNDSVVFSGIFTEKRKIALQKWLRDPANSRINLDSRVARLFARISGRDQVFQDDMIRITATRKGRVFPVKAWDSEYYKELLSAKYVLCPDGDFVWTYRFFEAIMCKAIPIVENSCDIYKGFHYYDMHTPLSDLSYSKDIARSNYEAFRSIFCVDKDILGDICLSSL